MKGRETEQKSTQRKIQYKYDEYNIEMGGGKQGKADNQGAETDEGKKKAHEKHICGRCSRIIGYLRVDLRLEHPNIRAAGVLLLGHSRYGSKRLGRTRIIFDVYADDDSDRGGGGGDDDDDCEGISHVLRRREVGPTQRHNPGSVATATRFALEHT